MGHPPVTLLNEIQEQPDLFRRILADWRSRSVSLKFPQQEHRYLVALAEGSSRHALEIAAPFLEMWTGLPVILHAPEALEEKFALAGCYRDALAADALSLYHKAFFVVVSQSGKTASVLRALEGLEQTLGGRLPLLTVTNHSASVLAETYGNNLLIGAGEEKSIAATKTLTATLMTLLLWGLSLGHRRKRIGSDGVAGIRDQLAGVADRVSALWEPSRMEALFRFTRKLVEVNHFVLLSKGPLTLVLPESGLKLTETSSNIVYTDNSESFKHGPKVILSGVNGLHPNSIYVVPTDADLAEGLYRDIRHHFWINPFTPDEALAFEDDRVFLVTFENSPPVPERICQGLGIGPEKILTLPPASTVESLFVGIVAFQLISYYLAVVKGESPDNPTLRKFVSS